MRSVPTRSAFSAPLAPALLLVGSVVLLSSGCMDGDEGARDTGAAPLTGEVRSADGVPIRYEAWGSGSPALVLVHGWSNTRAIWGEHRRTLSATNRVVALDLAGHGASGSGRTEWTMERFGEDVVAVADALGLERVVLVGFSMGGAVVLEAAERMRERVLGVVFVDTLHDPDRPPPPGRVEQMEAMVREGWGDSAWVRSFAFTPDAPAGLVAAVTEALPPEPAEHLFVVLRAHDAWMRTRLRPALEGLRAPLAAINTTGSPTDVEALRRYDPDFTLDTLQGVGHAGILLRRTEDFDARLRAIVDRFATEAAR